MPTRRASDPIHVQYVWDAINYIVSQRQETELNRIIKYLHKVKNLTLPEAELIIIQTHQDGLIESKTGTKNGKFDTFRVPTKEMPDLDGNDWYCFECHSAGEVTLCQNCFRVYHPNCIMKSAKKRYALYETSLCLPLIRPSSTKDSVVDTSIHILSDSEDANDIQVSSIRTESAIYDDSLCCVCNMANLDNKCNVETSELNYLLKFVLYRIQSWLPSNIVKKMTGEENNPEWLTDTELSWRANQLFFEHKDMTVIEVNLNNKFYTNILDFLADILTVQHNVAIFHGIESQEYGAAEYMVQDTLHDLVEIKHCLDCYKHSNEKINSNWFSIPCRLPHEIVWAKQKGYSYWPAKIIQHGDTHCDVRFFGGKHERAVLPKQSIKPITLTIESLQIKQSSTFNKSLEEMKLYEKLLHDQSALQEFINSSKKKKRFSSRRRRKSISTGTKRVTKSSTSSDAPNSTLDPLRAESILSLKRGRPPKKRNLTPETDSIKRTRSSVRLDNKKDSFSENRSDTIGTNVIAISDGEEESDYSFRESFAIASMDFGGSYEQLEQVTSSTEFRSPEASSTLNQEMQQLDQPFCDEVEKMRRKLENITDRKDLIKCAMDCMQKEIDRVTEKHNDHLKRLFESHNTQISETKKKQWCFHCEQDAIYHCCWNTAYCSTTCQQQHWQSEHKKVCRRKR